MPQSRRSLWALLMAFIVMVLIAGCGEMSKDEARKEVHQRVDKLAERLALTPEFVAKVPRAWTPRLRLWVIPTGSVSMLTLRKHSMSFVGRLPMRCATTAGASATPRT